MNYEQLTAKLIKDFGINSDQIYKLGKGFDTITVIRKVGMDQIEERLIVENGWEIKLKHMFAQPYKGRAYVGVLAIGKKDGIRFETTAGANPDNSLFHNYLEMAEKRAKHRLLLKIAGLSKYKVHSEAESKDFVPPDIGHQKAEAVAREAEKWTDDTKKFDKKNVDMSIKAMTEKLRQIEKDLDNETKKKEPVGKVGARKRRPVDPGTNDTGKPGKPSKRPGRSV